MANDTSTYHESRETVFRDENGETILGVRSEKFIETGQDGDITERVEENGIRLPDGFIWSPEMLKWNNPVLLTTCAICRNPPASLFKRRQPSSGLVGIRNARNCGRCGSIACSQHRRWVEGSWLCTSCARTSTLWSIIRPLFFHEDGWL